MTLSRRRFLKLSGAALLGSTVQRRGLLSEAFAVGDPPEWLPGVRLGRMTESRIRLYSRPNPEGQQVAFKYRDEVVTLLRDVVGLGFYPHNHVWFETAEGFAYSSWVQPVRYEPDLPLATVPAEGVYGEVCVPFTDAHAAPDPQSAAVYRAYAASLEVHLAFTASSTVLATMGPGERTTLDCRRAGPARYRRGRIT